MPGLRPPEAGRVHMGIAEAENGLSVVDIVDETENLEDAIQAMASSLHVRLKKPLKMEVIENLYPEQIRTFQRHIEKVGARRKFTKKGLLRVMSVGTN